MNRPKGCEDIEAFLYRFLAGKYSEGVTRFESMT